MPRWLAQVVAALRDQPLGTWAATVLFFGTSLLGTFLVPLFSVPDERFHVDMIFAAMDGDGYPRVGDRALSPAVEAAGRLMLSDQRTEDPLPPRSHLTSSTNPCDPDVRPVPKCVAEPTFTELGRAYDFTGPPNRMTTHAPLYYLVAGHTVATATTFFATELAFDTQVWLYRIVSVLLASTMPLLGGLGARQLGLTRPAATFAAVSVGVPTGLLMRNAPIVNNDNLVMVLLAAALVMLARVARRGTSPRAEVGLGLVLGLALLTKGFAMIFAAVLPISLLLLIHPERRWGQRLRQTATSTVRVAGIALVAGGWWVVRNLVRYGTVSESGFRVPTPTHPVETSFADWVVPWLAGAFRQTFQVVGEMMLAEPIALAAVLATVVWLLAVGTRQLGLRVATALTLPLVATLVVWGTRIFLDHLRHGEITAAQGRYYFPTMLGALLVLAAAVDRMHRRRPGPAAAAGPTLVVLAIVTAMTLLEVRAELLRSWSPDHRVASGLAQLVDWAPAPVPLLWMSVVIALAGVAGVARAAALDRLEAIPSPSS